MANLEDLKQILPQMIDEDGYFYDAPHQPYMVDMENWICVHATKYKPKRNKDGLLYINATGPATGYKYPRATVHFTLNQIVSSHMFGNWDAAQFVILAPYNEIVEKNGNPCEVATEDTYFIPNPDAGLILPENAHIVKPDNSTLFNIGEKVSTYKTDNFTNEEIETILSFMPLSDRTIYEKYDKCDFTEAEINNILWDDYTRQIYERSKDKRAFLHGLLSEDRIKLLTRFLRKIVVRLAIKKMGYTYVYSHEDEISRSVARVARAKGIRADGSDKGHSTSFEHMVDLIGCDWQMFIEICQKPNIADVYNGIVDSFRSHEYAARFISNEQLNMYQIYETYFAEKIERNKPKKTDIEHLLKSAKEHPEDKSYAERAKKALEEFAYADRLEQGGIKAYNPNLDIVLRRNAKRLEAEYTEAMTKLRANRDYPLLKRMLEDFDRTGRKWYKTPNGWQPENFLAETAVQYCADR